MDVRPRRRGTDSTVAPHPVRRAGAALLLSTNRFVYHAFYLNGHLLFAALLVVIAGAGWLQVRTASLSWLQLVAVPALIVTRPEGFLVAGLALLPTLLSARIPRRHRAWALAVYGVSCVALHAFLGWVNVHRGLPVSGQVVGGFAVGLAAVAGVRLSARPACSVARVWCCWRSRS